MTFGFTLFGPNGNPQGSSNGYTLGFKEKGTFNLNTNRQDAPPGTGRSLITTGYTEKGLIALRPKQSGGSVCVLGKGYTSDNSQSQWIIYSNVPSGDFYVDYWIFEKGIQNLNGPTDTMGIKIFDATGATTAFTSLTKYMKVIGVYTNATNSFRAFTVQEPAGKIYAIVQGSISGSSTYEGDPSKGTEDGGPGVRGYYSQFSRFGSTACSGPAPASVSGVFALVSRSYPSILYPSGPPADVAYGPSNFMVVDVTGL